MNETILVVDDDPDILLSIEILLESEGFTVNTSTKGEDAENLSSKKPDLILLDVLLSGKDGRDIALKLKSSSITKKIPIVMMSALSSVEKTFKSYKANDFV